MKTFLLLILLVLSAPSVNAQVDPAIDWKVLEEEHAVWIYDSRHKSLVDQYSKNFQRIFPHLREMFKEVPEKTTFVISDHTDLPNGSATVFPYPLVVIYPVIPIPTSPIGETDDSFFEILAHEYTHILNLYPVHGVPRVMSWVFGSIVRPNAYLPRWYAEGLAVFTESYYMPRGGRLRSQNFEGLMRSMGQAKNWPDFEIDQLNDFQPDWLGGRRAYLLGGALMHELATEYGLDSIYTLNQRYSRRIPYFINGPVKDQTALDYQGLLTRTYTQLQKRVDEQVRTISSAPVSRGTPVWGQGFHNHRPQFSPDGRFMAYLTRNDDVPSAIHLVERQKDKPLHETPPRQIAFGAEIEHMAWSPDSKILAYNSVENFKRYYIYSDIYLYDVGAQKAQRLTHGARTGDMVFTADGSALVFVQNIPGSKQIARLDIGTRQITPLYRPAALGTNLYSLMFKDQKVLFIEQAMDKRALKVLDLGAGNAVTTLNDNIATSRLQTTSEGILLTSSQSGVDNLYLTPDITTSSDLKNSRVLTNSLTRVFNGDIDPIDKTLYFSEQKENGVFLYAQPAAERATITQAPAVTPLLTIPAPPATPAGSEGLSVRSEDDFSSWPYMIPRYWMPFGYVLDGGMGFQASTGAADPLGKNAYNLMLEWDTLTKETGATVDYVNNSFPVEMTLSASQVYRYFYSTESVLRDTSFGAGANFNIPFMWRNWRMGLSWRQSSTEFVNSEIRRSGPTAHISYNSAVRRGYQISPETGTSFSLMHQSVIESLGNIGYEKTNLSFRGFFSPWLPKRHTLMFQANGTYAPELRTTALYTSTIGGSFFTNQLIPPFLVRGYPSGNFLGNNMGAATLEYRFPIADVYKGWDTVPFFIKQIRGSLIGDVVSLDGLRWSQSAHAQTGLGFVRSRFGDKWFTGYGAELDIECTLGYYLPVTFSFGVYRGDNRDVTDEDLSYFFMFKF